MAVTGHVIQSSERLQLDRAEAVGKAGMAIDNTLAGSAPGYRDARGRSVQLRPVDHEVRPRIQSMKAHLIGGPLAGEVMPAQSALPRITGELGGMPYAYRLVRWTYAEGTLLPQSPLFYVWDRLTRSEACAALDAYFNARSIDRKTLVGPML